MKLEKDKVKSLFILANFEVKHEHQLQNQYWPVVPNYYDLIMDNPWWLLMTQYGYIKIGTRKRVIEIDWTETAYRGIITDDNVTKTDTYVLAWTIDDCLKYLTMLNKQLASITII